MLVKDRLAQAAVVKAEIHFPDEYAEGKKLYNEAYNLFRDETYIESRQKSLKALDVMQYIRYIPPDVAETGLPAFYEVRLLPGNTDYLFNIAGYDFIYNNHWKWPLLYEANRDIMPEPGNPDLILPGMILKIPELEGETRSGTWRNGTIE
jgi:hypothetical protein